MDRYFNVNAACSPDLHYMVDLTDRLHQIRDMVDKGQYFTINRARQYGKTTILQALGEFLKVDYTVVSVDFQMISYEEYGSEQRFASAFSRELLETDAQMPEEIRERFAEIAKGADNILLSVLFKCLMEWCKKAEKEIVLIIDEVDSAANNQVFLDFLAQLRGYYIKRRKNATFHSVILAGVYDIKNLKRKFVVQDNHKLNSPWNIAADFLVDMSFSAKDIAGMLREYEKDYDTGMDVEGVAGLIYDYTSGYPYLVSRICKLIDERIAGSSDFPDKSTAWTKEGVLEAVKILLGEPNTLFESLLNKLEDYPELDDMLRDLLFTGKEIAYVVGIRSIEMALLFGFVKRINNTVVIANRIFETLLYNLYLTSPAMQQNKLYDAGCRDKNWFVRNGRLDMTQVLSKFVTHFDDLYGGSGQTFLEEDGRRYFLLYLKPIINGTGNYYIESRTRNMERTDVIIDYMGEQFVVELKIWRGKEYHSRGEKQLAEYLEQYHLEKGYLLSFNFNRNRQTGIKEVVVNGKILVEAVV